MKPQFYTFLLIAACWLLPQNSNADIGDCSGEYKTRVMLVGDSWAHFTWIYQAFGEALKQNGFPDIKDDANQTALISMQAETWASDGWIDIIKRRVRQKTDVDVYVVYIGGNDVMWKWRRDKPMSDLLPYTDEMLKYTDVIIDEILNINPDAQILIASYDYPNFAETMFEDNPYYSQWVKFGFAPPVEVNPALIYFEEYRANYPRYNTPNVHHINNIGVAQYYYGYPTPSIFEPFTTFPPRSVPLPNGDIRFPTHPNVMGLAGNDAYHFDALGYRYVSHNIIKTFLNDHLLQDYNYHFNSTGSLDGWVSSAGAVEQGGDVRIGKINDQEYAGVFTFNTDHFAEGTTIEKGSLFFTRKNGVGVLRSGANINDEVVVEMKIGSFGNSSKMEKEDYNDAADFTSVGCILGSTNTNEYKLRVDLNPEVLSAIAEGKQVQFRVKVNFGPNGGNLAYFDYYNGSLEDKYYAPTMYLKMSEVPVVGIRENKIPKLTIYPNPTSDHLNIDIPVEFRKAGVTATITNTIGSVVKSWTIGQTNNVREQVQLGDLPVGVYSLSMTDGNNIQSGNIVIQK
ncbi:MAG TPA: T9SS type A sorting domain-containing protein [Chitinophagales bacterium]|nr:T9SS type A sorting domain-containing protein [Chitinophagales bacterium]